MLTLQTTIQDHLQHLQGEAVRIHKHHPEDIARTLQMLLVHRQELQHLFSYRVSWLLPVKGCVCVSITTAIYGIEIQFASSVAIFFFNLNPRGRVPSARREL